MTEERRQVNIANLTEYDIVVNGKITARLT